MGRSLRKVSGSVDKPGASVFSLPDGETFERDTARMIQEIDDIVSGDWGYSVTDDMYSPSEGKYSEFTQEQAQEMSKAIGKVYLIAHAITCDACGRKYAKAERLQRTNQT